MERATSNRKVEEESVPNSLEEAVTTHIRRYFRAHGEDAPPAGLYMRILPLLERPLIVEALIATRGNQLKAACLLGLNRNTLRKKMQELGIVVEQGKA